MDRMQSEKSCLVCCCRRLVIVREVENEWFKKGRTSARVEEDVDGGCDGLMDACGLGC
jgi:hypothetical protein